MNQDVDPNSASKLFAVIIPGLFALFGGFIGALLTRRTEYKKWLRQERSSVFSDFLKRLNEATGEACKIVFDENSTADQRDKRITDLFCQLNGPENVVRLYLKERDRENFSRLLSEYWQLHFQSVKNERRVTEGKRIRETIQAIFERTLHH